MHNHPTGLRFTLLSVVCILAVAIRPELVHQWQSVLLGLAIVFLALLWDAMEWSDRISRFPVPKRGGEIFKQNK